MENAPIIIILTGVAISSFVVWAYGRDFRNRKVVPRTTMPCPYCTNPDRDFWIRDPSNNSGECKYRVSELGGSDPPCITDNYGTYRKYGA